MYNKKHPAPTTPLARARPHRETHKGDTHGLALHQPVTIHFGNGQLARLGEEIRKTGKTRGLLITSPFFGKNGLADRLMADSGGTLCATYRQVSPNPDIRECDDCIRLIHENHCDFIVALGGGSVLDCAKSAASPSSPTTPKASRPPCFPRPSAPSAPSSTPN